MSNSDTHLVARLSSSIRIVASLPAGGVRGNRQINSGDHNSALNPASLCDDMFVDNEIARARALKRIRQMRRIIRPV